MQAENGNTGSPNFEKCADRVTTEVLIIGFGFSTVPLLKELDRDGINYAIISSGSGSIWDRLEKHARLDFDMVSSMHSSLYSFELVKRDTKDRYLTSKEFSSFIKEYLAEYRSKAIDDVVTLIENYSTHSVVHTQSGKSFEAKHLVIATAFKRKMNQLLYEFDYTSAKNKTIAITGMGDSVNLMISKLIPNNNRIVLITNGFFLLDKLTVHDGISYTLDQLEYHNIRNLSYLLYRKTITAGLEFVVLCQKFLKFLSFNHMYFKHPLAIRSFAPSMRFENFPHSPFPNGIIAIKYWPIDTYQALFDNEGLKQSIDDGYLLNDIAFFLEQRLVELWPKQETVIDQEQGVIRWKDNVVRYDYIVVPDHEVPNLPKIVVHREGGPQIEYEYVYRNNFMGIVPKDLSKIYFIGFTRPTTGGLNNIIEMQCLFTHKIIADEEFNRSIYGDLDRKIRRYNNYYYYIDTKGHSDHLVHYGFYTDDIARLMKIGPRISGCRSIRDLAVYFFFPNAAFKYRQDGPYMVAGVKEMVQKIHDEHKGFSSVIGYLLTYSLLQLTAYVALGVAYFQHELPTAVALILFVCVLLNPVTPFVAANGIPRNSYVNAVLIAGLGLVAFYQHPIVPIASLFAAFALTYIFHRLGWSRVPFNDLKNKKNPKYMKFFQKYCSAARDVFLNKQVTKKKSSVTQDLALSQNRVDVPSPASLTASQAGLGK